MQIKKIITAFALCSVLVTECFASVLGNVTNGRYVDFGAGAYLYEHAFENNSTKQREFYVEYIPNSESVPVVLNGEEIYGKRTIKQAAKYYDDLNYRPLLAINADYFSLKTGIPMGHTISDGRLLTKDTTGQHAIGFTKDGKAFISWLEIQTKLVKEDNTYMNLDCINKWCFDGISAAYFLTDDFGKDTKTEGLCKYIIFSKESGNIRIEEEAEFVVEEKFDSKQNIAIPEDKYVLVMDADSGNPDQLAFMDSLNVGDKVKMTNESVYDKELWKTAENGLGSVGGKLVEKGEVMSGFEKGSAPRTAVGITEQGRIIFYVVDGRQSGYSTGLSLETLAKRMQELGCVEAINLDGGGSTAIAGVRPGSDTFEVLNKPSDGSLRSCANYIFLQDMRTPTNIAKTIVISNSDNESYLTGTKVKIDVLSVWDSSNYKMELKNPTFEISNGDGAESEITDNTVALSGNGITTTTIKVAEATKNLTMNVYNFPDDIEITDDNNKKIESLALNVEDNYSVALSAKAIKNSAKLISDPECFSYEVVGDIGEFRDNVFTANTSKKAEGKILVKAGQFTKEINVNIIPKEPFSDMKNHWAKDAVNYLYDKGIVSGIENNGELFYNPNNLMTRIEFSSLISKYLDIDTNEFENVKLEYHDKGSLAPWMLPYAKAMTKLGIINGIDGNFKANELLTRAQAATIIGRITPEEENLSDFDFSDKNNVPEWAYNHFAKLIQNGVINGYDDNTLKPNNNVTRAEAAKIIYNLVNNY